MNLAAWRENIQRILRSKSADPLVKLVVLIIFACLIFQSIFF